MKRFAHARPWQVHAHPQAVQPAADRRARAGRRGLRWVRRAIRSACACRSTAPGTAAGTPKGATTRQLLKEDIEMRKYIIETLPQAAISKVVIERPAKLCRISIYAARPGVIIGKKGADIEKLRSQLATMTDERRQAQHRRDPQAGDRRQARRPGHRRPAGPPRGLPPGDEARGAVGAASRRRGHQDHLRRPSRRRRDRPRRVVPRRPRAAAHAARQRRLCRSRGAHRLRRSSASSAGSSRARSSATIRWRRTG